MSLTVEDGTGIYGAESYATVAVADAYWAARTHNSLYTTWSGLATAVKEGALREATAFLDSTYGPYYRGRQASYDQGLLFPRSEAHDDGGYPLPGLPRCVTNACCELAARAATSRLAADVERGGKIKSISEQIGPLKTDIEYFGSAPVQTSYGSIDGMLAPVLNGSQSSAAASSWNWS